MAAQEARSATLELYLILYRSGFGFAEDAGTLHCVSRESAGLRDVIHLKIGEQDHGRMHLQCFCEHDGAFASYFSSTLFEG